MKQENSMAKIGFRHNRVGAVGSLCERSLSRTGRTYVYGDSDDYDHDDCHGDNSVSCTCAWHLQFATLTEDDGNT